ncbi:hypothetical protein DL96DRAFT_1821419 [Flagelloscypha sp. PMI_526]|nr:hypothetical protein DL96DRAFT_1821419 [Flagelloscypha sp. PMI_526]
MIFFHFLLPLFAVTFSFVVSSPTAPSLHHVSPRGPSRKIVGDIPIPSSPRIREWIDRFREMLPARQNGDTDNPNVDTAEIRQRYMLRPQRRYPHAVFYVNQRRTETMNDANPNWGTNRALQLRSLLEAELARRGDPHPESWTLYQAYDCPDAFGIIDEANNLDYPSDIRRAALSLNEERDWFRHTSAAFAEMVQGTVYLVVEEGEDAIGSDSIWRTHELPAIIRSQEVDEILEVRPANIGEALEGSRPLVLLGYRDPDAIRRQPTHGEPIPPVTTPEPVPPGVPGPPGPPPPPQSPPHREPPDHDSLKRGENPINVTIDPKKALEARKFPEIDLSNAVDFTPTPDPPPPPPKPPAPYQEGQCSIHLSQWKNPISGGGSPFDNPGDSQWTGPFSIEHDAGGTQIGYVPRTNANDPNALEMASKLEDKLRMTPEEWNDYIQFDLAQQH